MTPTRKAHATCVGVYILAVLLDTPNLSKTKSKGESLPSLYSKSSLNNTADLEMADFRLVSPSEEDFPSGPVCPGAKWFSQWAWCLSHEWRDKSAQWNAGKMVTQLWHRPQRMESCSKSQQKEGGRSPCCNTVSYYSVKMLGTLQAYRKIKQTINCACVHRHVR